jgi:transposase
MLGDKAYSSAAIRTHLRRRNIKATIPEPADQVKNRLKRGSKGGRPPAFDPVAYKQRNVVERRFASSASTGPWRPGTTNATSSGAGLSTWPRSGSGSVTPSRDLRDTP